MACIQYAPARRGTFGLLVVAIKNDLFLIIEKIVNEGPSKKAKFLIKTIKKIPTSNLLFFLLYLDIYGKS